MATLWHYYFSKTSGKLRTECNTLIKNPPADWDVKTYTTRKSQEGLVWDWANTREWIAAPRIKTPEAIAEKFTPAERMAAVALLNTRQKVLGHVFVERTDFDLDRTDFKTFLDFLVTQNVITENRKMEILS